MADAADRLIEMEMYCQKNEVVRHMSHRDYVDNELSVGYKTERAVFKRFPSVM